MAVQSTSIRQRTLRLPAQALLMALVVGIFVAAAVGLIRGESHLASTNAVQVQTVQGSFQPSGDGQSAYQRTGEKLQQVSPRVLDTSR